MRKIGSHICICLVILALPLTLACGSLGSVLPKFPPKPGTSNQPTGPSPMSGDWIATTDFGQFSFTVDPDGQNVTTAVFQMSGWQCGGTILSTELQSLSQWPISDGRFGGQVDLSEQFHTMTIEARYDQTHKQFVGAWDEDAYGTHCSGNWKSIPRK